MKSTQTPKAGLPQAIIILIISILPMMAIVALMPVIPVIIQHFHDVSNIMTLAPLIVAAPGICVALLSPYAGYLTDKLGRRKLLLIFTLFYGFGGILPFFLQDFSSLMAGRLLLGIGEAFILTIANTLLGDYFEESDRAKWLMWQSIAGAVSGFMLLSASGYLSSLGWNFPFLVYSIAFIVTIGTYFFIFEPKSTLKKTDFVTENKATFPLKLILRIIILTMLAAILYNVYIIHFSMALNAMGIVDQQKIGNYSAIASLAVPIGAMIFKYFSNRSPRFQFTLLFALIGIGLIGIGLSSMIEVTILFAWVQQLGVGMAIPILIAWAIKEVPVEFRGRGMGFWTCGFFLGQFLSPLAVSGMRNLTGNMLNAFVAFGVICLLAAASNGFLTEKKP